LEVSQGTNGSALAIVNKTIENIFTLILLIELKFASDDLVLLQFPSSDAKSILIWVVIIPNISRVVCLFIS